MNRAANERVGHGAPEGAGTTVERAFAPLAGAIHARHSRFFLLSLDMLCILDQAGRFVERNHACARVLGPTPESLGQLRLNDLAHPDDRVVVLAAMASLSDDNDTASFEARFLTRDNSYHWMHWSISHDHTSSLYYAVVHDTDQQHQTQEHMALLNSALQQASEAIMIADVCGDPPAPQIAFVNTAFCQLTGYSSDALVGQGPELLGYTGADTDMSHALSTVLREGDSFAGELTIVQLDGRLHTATWLIAPIHHDDGRLSHIIAVQRDGRRGQAAPPDSLDLLTGLPGRFAFIRELDAQIAVARGRGASLAVGCIDLDRFSRINDSLGPVAGDQVIMQVAGRLRVALPPEAVLARMGGDEFALILPHGVDEDGVAQAARQLLAALEPLLVIEGHEHYVSASIGVSVFPRDGADANTLIKHADSAMYRAKALGRNSVSWFEPALGQATYARLTLDNQLRRAIDQGQFELHYQPQIDLHSGAVIGVESLIRWQHPERGLLSPTAFITAAEESHLMIRICAWALHEACRQGAVWQRAGRPLRMAVNISARQFEREDIVEHIAWALRQSGLAPHLLDLEITESMLMHDPEGSAVRIAQLRAMGVRVTLDDFGTGYSSLAYLQKFPVDALKIDRSFVWGLERDLRPGISGVALVRAIVALAHSLGLVVVGEGVETPGQQHVLRSFGCDEAQGYLFARPVSPDRIWTTIDAMTANRPT